MLLRGFSLPTTGIYTILVHDLTSKNKGEYTLTLLTNKSKATIPQLKIGQPIPARLNSLDIHYWVFSASQNQYITIILKPQDKGRCDNSFSPVLELFSNFSNNEQPLNFDNYGSGQVVLLRGFYLPTTGIYTIWIHDQNFQNSCEYTLTLN